MSSNIQTGFSSRRIIRDNKTISWAEHYLIYLQDVIVEFDGFRALDIDHFGVYYNELRVVIGPNGAGKSTMCDIITSKTQLKEGNIFFNKTNIKQYSDVEVARMGIGRKFQKPTVFDSLTVLENMELALPKDRGIICNLWSTPKRKEISYIMTILERVGLADVVHTKAKYLSHGQRQWLAISMVIISKPKLLLVDEPAAGLTDKETELTAELLLELKGDHTIIVIEHDMDFVRMLNSQVTVLNEGKILAEGSLDEVQNNEEVVQAYLGR